MNSETKEIVMNLTSLNNFLSERIFSMKECCEQVFSAVLDEISDYRDMHEGVLRERMKEIKKSEKDIMMMCEAIEKYAQKVAKEQVKEAEEKINKKVETEKRSMILSMLKEGLSIDMISRITSLTLEQIQSIAL